ncbi:S-adenosyl-L-methionine-dependent methyltransferase [Artomyces pyxidatus]|uniref:S-adenosyl-L-methionine-dependent methyltransferase n=1 Tax=Artomyces pyxidatus TaxID=48021 RepID=A0ACB8SJ84_9AGAM|nr:S-adenosyl-L-methionine-dependent methyltransferase [Artomyces pyxidatus]
MSSPKDVLRGLVALINSAAEDAMRQYDRAGCEIPTIDAPNEQQLPSDTTELKKALRVLEGACRQLCITLTPPALTMWTRALATNDVACLRVAVSSKVADVIAQQPEGMHVKEIAEKTNLHQRKLQKVLRALAATHCFREVTPDVFANNPLSLTLRQENTISALVRMRATEFNKFAVSNFYDALVDPEYSHSLDKRRSAWSWGIRNEIPNGTMFDYMEAHPESYSQFHRAMGGIAKITGLEGVVNHFPWKDLPQGSTVCDVGSGVGMVSIELAKKYPNLHLMLQDLPSVVIQAQQFWAEKYPTAAEEQRVNFRPLDFFAESPAKDQDVYYIRQIIHDWPDEDCEKILKNVRAAMKPSSRVLIHEYIIPSNTSCGARDSGRETAPKPLLPNYGYGSTRTYLQDVNMLILLNAGERTLEEFNIIAAKTGLRFVKVWDFLETGVIEYEVDV